LLIARWVPLLTVAALGACGSGAQGGASSQADSSQHIRASFAGSARRTAIALRVPAEGGAIEAYAIPSLAPLPGAVRGRVPAIARVVGLDAEYDYIFLRTPTNEILGVDLTSGRLDTVATAVERVTLGPDGTLFTVDAKRRVTTLKRRIRFAWPEALPAVPRDMFGGTDQRLVALLPLDPPRLVIAGADQPAAGRDLVLGGDIAATFWGDLVAAATDSGVLIVSPGGGRDSSFVPIPDNPRAIAFSPAGHRIYVAKRSGLGLAVIDRYDRKEIDGIALPGPAATVRIDPLGRWLLARPATGDSVWLVDLPIKQLHGGVATSWQADLPSVGPDGSIVVRQDDDIVALNPDSLRPTGRVRRGAQDLWVLTAWRPASGRGGAGAAASTSASSDSGAASSEGPLYVQVSVSQNQEWSRAAAQQLVAAGLPATVLAPEAADDGYRVVLGPYASRSQAEAIGRKLGRPYWIYQPSQAVP
jgi:hypothetical protein